MAESSRQEGIVGVLMEHFEKHRLPRILAIKEHVDQGQRLREIDLDFLEQVLQDAKQNMPLIDGVPECQSLFARVVHLYNEIAEKALANEKRA